MPSKLSNKLTEEETEQNSEQTFKTGNILIKAKNKLFSQIAMMLRNQHFYRLLEDCAPLCGPGGLMGFKASAFHVLRFAKVRFTLLHHTIRSSLESADIKYLDQIERKKNYFCWNIKSLSYYLCLQSANWQCYRCLIF